MSTHSTVESRDGVSAPGTQSMALTGLASAVAFIGIIFVSGVLFSTEIPRPDAPVAETQQFFVDNAAIVQAGALVRVVAAVLLVAFCAIATGVVRRVDSHSAGMAAAVIAGGTLTAVFGTLSVLFALALPTEEATASLTTTDALRQLNFLTGGAGYTVWLGLVAGPLCLVLRRAGALPSWLATAGLVSATFAFLSPVSLVADPALLFIPLGRFSSLLVVAAVSVLMATGRVRAGRYRTSRTAAVIGGIGTVVLAMLVTIVI